MGRDKSDKKKRVSSSSSSSSDSDSDGEKERLRALKKKLRKEQRKTEKYLKKKLKEKRKKLKKRKRTKSRSESIEKRVTPTCPIENEAAADIPIELMDHSKSMAPMTKEEWDKRQSVIRKVLDEDTGRYRLIKGDGEVLEEIVSHNRHKQINKQATMADGNFFKKQTKTNHIV